MTTTNYKYYAADDLIERLSSVSNSKDRSVTFLLGSAVSAPDYIGAPGVPGVSGVIDLIRNEFEGTESLTEFDKLLEDDSSSQYQRAFEFLI